jgi:hypothetical protein
MVKIIEHNIIANLNARTTQVAGIKLIFAERSNGTFGIAPMMMSVLDGGMVVD